MKIEQALRLQYGVIRYAPDTGAFPDEDLASSDGWYASRDDALMVYRDWVDQFPRWVVALVKCDDIQDGSLRRHED